MSHVLSVKRLSGLVDLERTLSNVRTKAKKFMYNIAEVPLSDIVLSKSSAVELDQELNQEGLLPPSAVQMHPEWVTIKRRETTRTLRAT